MTGLLADAVGMFLRLLVTAAALLDEVRSTRGGRRGQSIHDGQPKRHI